MVHSVKGGTDIEQCEKSDVTVVDCAKDVSKKAGHERFSRVVLSKAGLERRH